MSTTYQQIKDKEEALLMHTYGRYPVAIERGKGVKLYGFDGKEYLDLLSGIAVAALGHGREDVAEAMAEQARKLVHVSNLFYQEEQLKLAEKLLATCQADKVFFANSGAEANEAAIKLARRYMRTVKQRDAFEIVTLEGSFHGRTLATLTATGQRGPIKDGFGPLPSGFVTVPFGDSCALRDAVGEQTAAIMVEAIQGEGGIRPLPEEYVNDIAALCKEKDILLIVDEVQAGLGRTGKMWGFQHYNLKPDIFTSAKALGGGLPMSACLATKEAAKGFGPGSHATTMGGGPVQSTLACMVLDALVNEDLPGNAARMGEFLHKEVGALIEKYPEKIAQVRGKGLMVGIVLTFPGKEVWQKLIERGFLLNLTQERVLRLLPPLIIGAEDLASFVAALDEVLAETDV